MSQGDGEPFVGLLAVGMCAAGVALFVGLYRGGAWMAPRLGFRRRPNPWLRWGGLAVAIPLTLTAMFLAIELPSIAAVVATYGWNAWAGGVEVVNKHGLVSNGETLGPFWRAAIGAWILPCWLVCLAPALIWNETFRDPDQLPDASKDRMKA
ncbi:MAG TPA: hypothetical protein VGN57_17345 [Pirellulaceae bacterium]|jgi:hypothetical protein|nr:hypothetical protein [Pirellulaceae bacterium]